MGVRRRAVGAAGAGIIAAAVLATGGAPAAAQGIITSATSSSRRVALTWSRADGDTFHTADLDSATAASLGLGRGANMPGRSARQCNPADGTYAFAGYKIWRKAAYDPGFALLRKCGVCDTLYYFGFQDLDRRFADPDSIIPRVGRIGEDDPEPDLPIPGPFDGFEYEYSVTAYDLTRIGSTFYEVDRVSAEAAAWPEKVQPNADPDRELPYLDRVRVVPNPFDVRALWSAQPKLQFQNLPSRATIKVFTLAGDLVRVLEHAPGDYDTGTQEWDLKNGNGEEVVAGVYLYLVKAASGEEASGQFVIIR
jgi:hypothetical protein